LNKGKSAWLPPSPNRIKAAGHDVGDSRGISGYHEQRSKDFGRRALRRRRDHIFISDFGNLENVLNHFIHAAHLQ